MRSHASTALVLAVLMVAMPLMAPARSLLALDHDAPVGHGHPSRALQQAGLAAIAKNLGVAASVLPSLASILGITEDALAGLLKASSVQYSQPAVGAVWVSSVNGNWGSWSGQVLSAYYHPSREHTATTVGKLGTKSSKAAKGTWAVSQQTKGLWGNKAFYNTL